tara:strand:- start:2263 stop:3228 length:966 start_codon:yes stop_codon:yes gene_type:complete
VNDIANSSSTKEIWAIGGGKGGVGKSFVAGNLGILLAQRGFRVILADLDLGGANLHTWLGVNTPEQGVSEFVDRQVEQIHELLIPTSIPQLRLISGARDGVEIANLKHTQKMRFLMALKRLDTDFIIMDLGAGTAYNTIDFFLLAEKQLMVVIPEPTSIENAYRFLKNSFYRKLRHTSSSFGLRNVVDQMLKNNNSFGIRSPRDLIEYLKQMGGNAASYIDDQLEHFQPNLIINQTRSESDIRIGKAMEKACSKYFGLTLNFSGYVEQHEGVRESVLRRKPVTLDKPESLMSQQLKTISEHLLKSSNISTPLTPKYSRLIP